MEKDQTPIYWTAAAVYYIPVLLGVFLGWFSLLAMFILLYAPVLVLPLCRLVKFRALTFYLEENHPEEWGRIAGQWLRGRYGRVTGADKFVFSDELDDDPCMRIIKKNYRHLSVITYGAGAIAIIFILYISAIR